MAFLTKEELRTVSDINIVNKIIALDDSIVTEVIDESIDLMKSYLSRFYDVDTIFSQSGEERKKAIVKKLKDIVIYELYTRNKWSQVESVLRSYNEAINWLEKLNTGEFGDHTLPDIPESDEPPGTDGNVRFGGNQQYSSRY